MFFIKVKKEINAFGRRICEIRFGNFIHGSYVNSGSDLYKKIVWLCCVFITGFADDLLSSQN